ncbi:MAG: O-methyltransferase [Elusimicrobia bacterium]|nr:O-methyltransferase [Elusimicrobiota bacterium]
MVELLKKGKKTVPHHTGVGRGEYRSEALLGFVREALGGEDPAFKRIREETPKKGLPPISIGPDEGQLLSILVQACGAKKAVEVGTLAGYSACWIAAALPDDGVLHTIEFDPKHAAVARDNIKAAGLASKVTVHVGPGSEILPTLDGEGPYDLCFIDADKVNYPVYLRWAVENVRSGGLVVGDNAYLFGKVHLKPAEAGEDAPGVPAMRAFLKCLADRRYFTSCAMIPTGEGMAVAVRR